MDFDSILHIIITIWLYALPVILVIGMICMAMPMPKDDNNVSAEDNVFLTIGIAARLALGSIGGRYPLPNPNNNTKGQRMAPANTAQGQPTAIPMVRKTLSSALTLLSSLAWA